jgi:hypothetical protein
MSFLKSMASTAVEPKVKKNRTGFMQKHFEVIGLRIKRLHPSNIRISGQNKAQRSLVSFVIHPPPPVHLLPHFSEKAP